MALGDRGLDTPGAAELMAAPGPAACNVPVDPEQTYFPKIASRVTATGEYGVESASSRMSPDLEGPIAEKVFRFLGERVGQ